MNVKASVRVRGLTRDGTPTAPGARAVQMAREPGAPPADVATSVANMTVLLGCFHSFWQLDLGYCLWVPRESLRGHVLGER